MANAYFLFMTALQLVPGLGDLYGAATTLMPLLLIVAISALKDAFEDNKRRKSDTEENKTLFTVAPRGQQAHQDMKS